MSRILNLKVVFFVAAVATILCAILIPRFNANATIVSSPRIPATSNCVSSVHLLNGQNDTGKFNMSNNLWRAGSGSTYTAIVICNEGSYDTIQDVPTGNYMDYVSGTGVTETTDSGLARAHWVLTTNCGGGYYEYKNAYIGQWLVGDAVGTSLYLSSPVSCEVDQEWALDGN